MNDAPALREAHIGIAMGRTGTEVTREASDIVLADDNFATIVAAVEEGRGIFDNIRKTIVYLLAGNVAELAVVFAAALVGLPAPLLPLHLLWINLVTDGAPALALGVDPADDGLMQQPPRPTGEGVITPRMWRGIILVGITMAAGTSPARPGEPVPEECAGRRRLRAVRRPGGWSGMPARGGRCASHG